MQKLPLLGPLFRRTGPSSDNYFSIAAWISRITVGRRATSVLRTAFRPVLFPQLQVTDVGLVLDRLRPFACMV